LPESKISILHEPVAAAISYFYSENMRMMYDRNQTVLVFDLGGGTFDVTVVEHDPFKQQYDIKAKEGDLKLGGNDWDEALGKLVLKKAGISGDFSSDEEKGEFQSQMTRLKHMLSELDVQPTVFRYNGKQITVTVERSEFEDATKHLLDRTIEVTKKAIDSCGGTSVIDEIVMVGGSSNMPQIRERIKAEFPQFGKYDIKLHDPSKAIAKGAAIYAKKMIDKCISFEGDVSDIVTHTYGISSRRVRDNKDMIYNLLYKGTKFEGESVTASSVSGFTALEDTQRYLTFTVYESDGIRGEGEDANWMDFGGNEKKNGIEATIAVPEEYIGRARSFSCLVTLEINRDGVLNMHITDKDGKLVNVKE